MAGSFQHRFKYTPLVDCPRSNCPRSIRLLELLPGHLNSSVHCNLINTTLTYHQSHEPWHTPRTTNSPAHSFVALSYEWGNPHHTTGIFVNGESFNVRMHLHQCLRQIRAQWAHRLPLLMWVDAISINQLDLEEKNKQVSMMHEIYAHAKEVIVWLGKEADSSDVVLQRLRAFSEHEADGKDDMSLGTKKGYATRTGDIQAIMRNMGQHYASMPDLPLKVFGEKEEINSAFIKLCRRSYWSRAWIVQEVLLAKAVSLFCGTEHLPHGAFVLLGPLFEQLQRSRKYPYLQGSSPPIPNYEYLNNEINTDFDPGTRVLELTARWRIRRHDGLESLLQSYTGSMCTDPHDKVYAFLGLCGGLQEFPIDYTCPLPMLLAQAVVYCNQKKTQPSEFETDPIRKSCDSIHIAQLLLKDLGLLKKPSTFQDVSTISFDLSQTPVTVELDYRGPVRQISPNGNVFKLDDQIYTPLNPRAVHWGDRIFALRGTNFVLIYRRTLTRLYFVTAAVLEEARSAIEEIPISQFTDHGVLSSTQSSLIPKYDFPVPYNVPIYSIHHGVSIFSSLARRLLLLLPQTVGRWVTTRGADGYYASPFFHMSLAEVLRIVSLEPERKCGYEEYVAGIRREPQASWVARTWIGVCDWSVRARNTLSLSI